MSSVPASPLSRVRLGIVAGGLVLGLAYFWALAVNTIVFLKLWNLHLNDLGKFYYDGVAFLHGGSMYGSSLATSIEIKEGVFKEFVNLNPPHFQLFILPLAFLPEIVVVMSWLLSGLVLLALSLDVVARRTGIPQDRPVAWAVGILLFMLSHSFVALMVTGQITLHFLPLVVGVWFCCREGRWQQAGAIVGLLAAMKPFFLLFLPWVVIRGGPRTLAVALGTGGALVGTGLGVFGLQAYRDWSEAVSRIDWYGVPMNGSLRGWIERVLHDTLHYQGLLQRPDWILPGWVLGFVVIGVTSLLLALRGRRPVDIDHGFALLLAAMLLMAPLGWAYYTIWLLLPVLAIRFGAGRVPLPLPVRLGRDALLVAALALQLMPWGRKLDTHELLPASVGLGSGSVVFWSLLAVWLALVVQAAASGRQPTDYST